MTTIKDMSTEDFIKLLDEYFAPPEKRTKMTSEEIKDLAERLNKKINVPLINETNEEKILIKIVIQIDRFLYDNLPNELYDIIRSPDNGISDTEAKRLTKSLSELANKQIDIPYIPDAMELIAIKFVIGVVINAARKQWDIHRAKKAIENSMPDMIKETEEKVFTDEIVLA